MWRRDSRPTPGAAPLMTHDCYGCTLRPARSSPIISPMKTVLSQRGPTSVCRSLPLMFKLLELSSPSVSHGLARAVYQGVLADWALSPYAWTELVIQEYFSVGPEELPNLNVWDKISSFIVPGDYPAVIDVKGRLTDGALINGDPSGFVA